MHVSVDQDRCIASGQCVLMASQVFDQRDEDGTVVLLDAEPPLGLARHVQEAANLCPGRAITLLASVSPTE
jgi:ferredoxin